MRAFGRRGLVRSARRLGVLAPAAALIVALAQSTTTAAFTAGTANGGNQATTASTFCPAAGSATLTPIADTAVYQASPGTNYGSGSGIGVGVGTTTTANAYSYVKFDLVAAAIPGRCTVTAATLTIRASSPSPGATLQVFRADAAWNPGTMTWATGRVGFTGTPVSTASVASAGLQTWDVTVLTRELHAGPNHGFALRDSAESAGTSRYQTWDSMESGTAAYRPKLALSWA